MLLLLLIHTTLRTAKAVTEFQVSADWASAFCVRVSA